MNQRIRDLEWPDFTVGLALPLPTTAAVPGAIITANHLSLKISDTPWIPRLDLILLIKACDIAEGGASIIVCYFGTLIDSARDSPAPSVSSSQQDNVQDLPCVV